MNEIPRSLKSTLKRLRLSGVLNTLEDRLVYSQKAQLDPLEFLELVLQDEIERRDHKSLGLRLSKAGFELSQTLESFDFESPVHVDRQKIRDLFSLGFVARHEDVILLGPVGVGKTHLATALGHAACRAGHQVLFLRAEQMLKQLAQSRVDNSSEKAMRRLLTPDVLILDDFGLRTLNAQQSSDFYELVIERHRRGSTIVTSNRAIEEWIPLFADPILAQSALDRLAHNAHQLVIEGDSYRRLQRPGMPRSDGDDNPSPDAVTAGRAKGRGRATSA